MGVDRKIYEEKFLPVVQPNEFVQTYPKIHYYQVNAIYTLPWIPVDVCDIKHLNAALVVNAESADIELSDIYLDDLEIGQFRFIPREDFAVTWMGKPLARPFYTIKNSTARVPTYYDDPRTNEANQYLHLHEIFQFEDTKCFAKVTCYSPIAGLASAHLDFFGYRFLLIEITKASIPAGIRPTVLPTEGYPGTVTPSS